MYKLFTISIVPLLLLSSMAFADTGQVQTFNIGLDNVVGLLEGSGVAVNTNVATVVNEQIASDIGSGTTAVQVSTGAFVQGASTTGAYGLFVVEQDGQASGWQINPGGQWLQTNFLQQVFKSGGIGLALGIQSFVGSQVQHIMTPFGVLTNVDYIGVARLDGIGGWPFSSNILSKGINVGGSFTFH